MKPLILLGALVAVALAQSNLKAADIPQGQLAAIGLGNMKTMSHDAALQVRGRGLGENGGGWWDDRRGWNSWGDKSHHEHHHEHHQVAPCQAPSHGQPCLPPCHIASGVCGGFGGTAVALH